MVVVMRSGFGHSPVCGVRRDCRICRRPYREMRDSPIAITEIVCTPCRSKPATSEQDHDVRP